MENIIHNSIANIESMLKDEFEDSNEIDNEIKNLKLSIDEFELEDDKKMFGSFKFKVHDLSYKYYKKIGNYDLANKHLDISARYGVHENRDQNFCNSSIKLNTDATKIIQTTTVEDKSISTLSCPVDDNDDNRIRNAILKINDGVLLEHFIKHLNHRPLTLQDYVNYRELHVKLVNILEETVFNIGTIQEKRDVPQNEADLLTEIFFVKVKLSENYAFAHCNFMQSILKKSKDNIETTFFKTDGSPVALNSCYRKLSLYFHPDKNRDLPSHTIQVKAYELLTDVYLKLTATHRKTNYQYDDLFNEATIFIKYGVEYYYASKQMWPKMQCLSKKSTENVDMTMLRNLSITYFDEAYKRLKIACVLADAKVSELFEHMLVCRFYIAGCLYMLDKYLESQLVAVSCIFLCRKFADISKSKHKQEATNLLQSIQSKKMSYILHKLTSSKLFDCSETAPRVQFCLTAADYEGNAKNNMILVQTGLSNANRHQYRQCQNEKKESFTIFSEIIKIDKTMLNIKGNDNAPKNEIDSNAIQGAAAALIFIASWTKGLVATARLVTTSVGAYELVIAGGVISTSVLPVILPAVWVVGCAASVVYNLVSIYKNHKKITWAQNVLKVRQKLDEIVLRAQLKHAENKFKDFLEILSEQFDGTISLIVVCFAKAEKRFEIDPEHIKRVMNECGFKPDGIAQLLVLLFEALLSYDRPQDFTEMNLMDTQIKSKAIELLTAVIENPIEGDDGKINLEKIALDLDQRLSVQRRFALVKVGMWEKLVNNLKLFKDFIATDGKINDDMIKNFLFDKSPFISRLSEVRNIALINKFMYAFLYEQNETLATNLIKQIKTLLDKDYKHVTVAHHRFEAIRDFIWLFTSDTDFQEVFNDHNSNNEGQSNGDESLHFSNNQIDSLLKEAKVYEIEAANALPAEQMSKWSNAKRIYQKVIHLLEKEKQESQVKTTKANAQLAHARCLLQLAEYSLVEKFIQKYKNNEDFYKKADFWIICSILYRKCHNNYGQVYIALQEATKVDDSIKRNHSFIRENKIVESLQKFSNTKQYIQSLSSEVQPSKGVDYSDPPSQSSVRGGKRKTYRILSIDGGGIRGIIPSVWLREIEMELKKPIHSVFDCIAGTSTGAIVGAALTLPDLENYGKPKYGAEQLVQLYMEKANTIFENKSQSFANFWQAKYSNNSRADLFKNYFGDRRIKDSLTDLVIPAISESNRLNTFAFTSFGAKKSSTKNFLYYDALMSTTAAPTYFPAHHIENFGIFHDGGLTVNNPAEIACAKVNRYYKLATDDMFVLSLGTGSFLPEANFSGSKTNSGWIHWARNLSQYTMGPHEGDVDVRMRDKYGSERYKRWQFFTEREIELDKCDDRSLQSLVESARQYVEELKFDESGSFNKLIEALLDDA